MTEPGTTVTFRDFRRAEHDATIVEVVEVKDVAGNVTGRTHVLDVAFPGKVARLPHLRRDDRPAAECELFTWTPKEAA